MRILQKAEANNSKRGGKGISSLNFATDTLFTAISRGLTFVLGFAITVLIARGLGPEGQGEYMVVVIFAATVTQFANLGLHCSNTYFLAADKALYPALLGNSFWISLGVGGSAAILAVLAAQTFGWGPEANGANLWWGALMVPQRLFFMLGGNLLVGLNRIRLYGFFQILSFVMLIVPVALVGYYGGGVDDFLVATWAAWTATALLLWLTLTRGGGSLPIFRVDVLRTSLAYATRAYLAGLFAYVVLRVNVFTLDYYHGSAAVGQYSVAAYFLDALSLVPVSLATILFPRLVQEKRRRWPLLMRALVLCAALMFVCCTACAVLAGPLVPLIFGVSYMPVVPILWCLLPAIFFYGLISIVSQYLAAEGNPRAFVGIWGGTCLFAAALGALLIPTFGSVGAALTLSIVYVSIFALEIWLACLINTTLPNAAGAVSPPNDVDVASGPLAVRAN
jgi:O-antigen/teichoic acid export membrane protein